jgi:hypothetical protein
MPQRAQHERRTEPRLLCADLVTVRWEDPDGVPHEEMANLEDISDHGVCIQTESEIAAGSTVEIAAGKVVFRGEVRYCRKDELGNFVGVQMPEGWPKRFYRPKHLLDPRTLMADRALRDLKP